LSLWVGGDSTAVYMGQGLTALARALGGTVSGEFYKNSTGLTRPDFFDWRQEFADEMARARPNVAVVMLGANDLQGIVAADGRSYQPGTDGWRAEYTRRLDAALDTLTADPDRLVVWVGQPIMEPSEYNAGIQQLNDLFAAEAQKRPNVVYVDAYDLFADGHGQYQVRLATAQGDQDLRAADGIHFTVAGGQYLADAVMKAIRSHKELILGGSAGG
jgi:hypothetical protein